VPQGRRARVRVQWALPRGKVAQGTVVDIGQVGDVTAEKERGDGHTRIVGCRLCAVPAAGARVLCCVESSRSFAQVASRYGAKCWAEGGTVGGATGSKSRERVTQVSCAELAYEGSR